MGAHYEFAHTDKQAEIMRHILDAVDKGAFIRLDELRAKLSYGPVSKQTVLCSLRFLEKHGFLTKHYFGPKPMEIRPTLAAYSVFRGTPDRCEDLEALTLTT